MADKRPFISREIVVPGQELLWFLLLYLVLLLSGTYVAGAAALRLGFEPWLAKGVAMLVFGVFFFSAWRLWQRARGADPIGWTRIFAASIVLGSVTATGALLAIEVG